ncbi:hypothetical protein, partial [Sulfitobacter sp. HI0040]
VAQTVSHEAASYADQTKETAADEVKSVSSALRHAADDLRSGSPQERTFSQIADGLADASEAIRGKDLGELVNDLNSFAKRNPAIFLGSAALIGFAATRFAKASSSTSRGGGYGSDRDHSEMDRPVPSSRAPVSAAPGGGTTRPTSSATTPAAGGTSGATTSAAGSTGGVASPAVKTGSGTKTAGATTSSPKTGDKS